MKKNIIIITAIASGLFGYNYWINTPQYSLLQIQKSIDSKDRHLFEKYVDSEGIIEEAVEDISKIFIEEMDDDESTEHSFFDPKILVAGLVSMFQPAIEKAIEKSFDEFWEDEIETIESAKLDSDLASSLEFLEISYIEKEGKIVKLGIEGRDPDSGNVLKIEFKLNKIDNYWRVTKILNLEELLRDQMDKVEELIDLDT